MADLILHREKESLKTSIPNYFIDAYMVHAKGEYIKVYLYLLRCMNDPYMNFSVSECADKFEFIEKDVVRALKYWEKVNLIRLEFDDNKELVGICFRDYETTFSDRPSKEMTLEKTSSPIPEKPKTLKEDELNDIVENDEELSTILFVAEKYFARPLTNTEMNSIIFWKDSLGFSEDLIDYLIDNCVSNNHKSIKYMDKVAEAWARAGYTTVEEAKNEHERYSKANAEIKKAFGISGRDFAAHESGYIAKWSKDFSTELICLACERTVRATNQVSFEYAESILRSWKNNNVTSLEDVKALDEKFKAERKETANNGTKTSSSKSGRFGDFTTRGYNITTLEQELLYDYATDQ